jgi:hypothetical protein
MGVHAHIPRLQTNPPKIPHQSAVGQALLPNMNEMCCHQFLTSVLGLRTFPPLFPVKPRQTWSKLVKPKKSPPGHPFILFHSLSHSKNPRPRTGPMRYPLHAYAARSAAAFCGCPCSNPRLSPKPSPLRGQFPHPGPSPRPGPRLLFDNLKQDPRAEANAGAEPAHPAPARQTLEHRH